MLSELEQLESAVSDFVKDADELEVDPKRLRSQVERLEGKFARVVRRRAERGDHLAKGHCSAVSWVMSTCAMSQGSASDRLCVGKQLEALPEVAEKLGSGEIGYQSAAVICHLSDKLGEKGESLDQAQWIAYAGEFSIKDLNRLSNHTRYVVDPNGFDRETEENYAERFLHISEMNGMYHLSGVMDPEGGLGGGRCRARDAGGLGRAVARTESQAPLLRFPRLRPADQLDPTAPHRVLVARWSDQPAQAPPPLLLPPPPGS